MKVCLLFFAALFLSADVALATELMAVPDLTINYLDSHKSSNLQSGQTLNEKITEPLWITSNGRIPVLVFPLSSSTTSQIKIDPPLVSASSRARCDMNSAEDRTIVSTEMSRVIVSLFEIQKLISMNKEQEARLMFDKLQAMHPEVVALDFLGASLDVLETKRDDAKVRLQNAVKAFPEYEDGANLLKSLEDTGSNK
jgi:hypothetical protein